MKTCRKCGIEKPFSDFHRSKGRADGRQSRCKECRRGRKNDPAVKLRARLRYEYAITPCERTRMRIRQHDRCAICGEYSLALNIDHCHETKTVRGLLCGACNLGLGQFQDDPNRLRAATDYLERT